MSLQTAAPYTLPTPFGLLAACDTGRGWKMNVMQPNLFSGFDLERKIHIADLKQQTYLGGEIVNLLRWWDWSDYDKNFEIWQIARFYFIVSVQVLFELLNWIFFTCYNSDS